MSEPAPQLQPPPIIAPAMPVVDYYAGGPRPPAEPTAEAQRIESIDVLRGFAVIGILFVNIQFMALPMQQVEDLKWRTMPVLDGAARLIVHIFFELKFITLFSFLFGAGLSIMMERLEGTGRPFVSVYVRRLLVLLGIGIFHGVFLWYGDILAVYAVLGFAALLFRHCRPRTLLIWAATLFVIPVIGLMAFAAYDPKADWSTPDWSSYATSGQVATSQPTSGAATAPAAAQSPQDPVVRFFAFLDDEIRVYRTGSYGEVTALRASFFLIANLFVMPILYIWRCLAMFLLGMCAVKLRIFSAEPAKPRWGLAIAAGALGLAMEFYADRIQYYGGMRAGPFARGSSLSYFGSFFLAVAYATVILNLASRPALQRPFRPVASLGRMALSNYLMHSIIGGLIFYSHGLGLFGTMGSAALFGITSAILALQLILSPLWLRHFQFGPVEWLWRTATYGKAQPMRRTVA